jgi:cysteine desulfurase
LGPIYLDNHATTPVDPRVLEAMLPCLRERFGNPASISHRFGWDAAASVGRARGHCAALIGAEPHEIVFTSGATESNNLALKGLVEARRGSSPHIITVATEHQAVLDTVSHLERQGCRLTILPVEPDGRLDPARLNAAITDETLVVSVMYANNEIGVIHPIRKIGEICRDRGVVFHCDAAQALGKVPIDIAADHIDLLSASAHKLYGPKGVGFLYVRRGAAQLTPLAQMDGGGHEGGFRSGTLNVPGIVGLGEACAICAAEMPFDSARLATLRDRLLALLRASVEGVHVNGSMEHRLPHNLNVSIPGIDADALLAATPEIAVSTGSACSSGHDSSYVLRALGAPPELLQCVVRFGLGRFTTAEEIESAAERIAAVANELRRQSVLIR